VPPDFSNLTDQINLTPASALGIPVAVVAAVFLSLGAQFQHRGVVVVEEHLGSGEKAGLSIRQLRALMARPSWVIGTVLLGLAIVLQLTSLGIAPILVVQPLGAVALVMTAIMNSRASKIPLDAVSIRAIVLCVVGVGVFVTVAAPVARSNPITQTQLIVVLVILAVVLTTFAMLFALLRKSITPIFYIVGAGFLFGFVATLAKVIIDRVKTIVVVEFRLSDVEWLLILCFVGLILAALLGTYFVQTAYASGPPDLVVAGLTVIDPLVAVSIGIIVLGEAANAPLWAIVVWILAGATAIYGVLSLSRHHTEARARASVS
jgi:hypothetical protein